jgi:hypothetical protein
MKDRLSTRGLLRRRNMELEDYNCVLCNEQAKESVEHLFIKATYLVQTKDDSGSGSGRISAGFGSCGFGFRDDFSPTVFGFGFGFGFPPVDIQWISEINHLELKLMLYNMLIITCLLRLLNLFKIDS